MRQCSSSYRMSAGLDRRTNVDVQILSAASKAIAEKCFWNACKALSFGLFLMAVGAIMAIIGYYAEQLSSDDIVSKTDNGNSSTSIIRTSKTTKKSSHIYKLSYAGPIVMGVGGFIVVAACVMTFEARDRAAKFMSNQLKIMGGGGGTMSGHRGHGRQTPNTAGYLSRGDSGRSNYMQNLCDAGRHKMNKSPSAPNLAAMNRGPGSVMTGISNRLPLRHKHTVHAILSPGGGRALLSPHTLRRQAMSMDTQDYNPFFSPPRSRHSSSGMLTYNNNNNNNNNNIISSNNNNNINCINNNNNKQGSCNVSRESVNDPRARGSRGSMVLDLHVPNECSVTMRVRDRSRRSDTARRHLLRRQTPVELDDSIIAYASSVATNTAAVSEQKRQRAKRCTRSATCDVPHVVKSKRRRQDSSCSDVVAHRRRSGSPVCVGTGCVNSSSSGGWRSSANDVVDTIEWSRTAGRGSVSAVSSPQRVNAADCSLRQTPVQLQSTSTIQGNANGKMSLSRTCSDIMSIDKSFEESNYSSS